MIKLCACICRIDTCGYVIVLGLEVVVGDDKERDELIRKEGVGRRR